ncbi:MAG: siphovirus ReqiPepy6 Gp37-like family protein [Lachnospiraceae bacterium]|nr:siphovirus ReqiPepy6 Gp37-like family protein [Lachnospiraceae bacterium]
MTLKVYAQDMTPLGLAEDFTTVTWTRRAREPSECEIVLPVSSLAVDLLEVGNIVMKLEDTTGEAMQIESRTIEMDDEGRETLTVKARGLMAWLSRRVNLAAYDETTDMTPQDIAYMLIRQNATQPSANKRKLPLILNTRASFGQDEVTFSASEYQDICDLVTDQLTEGEMNLFVTTDPVAGTHTLDIRQAVDKTATSAEPVLISIDFGTLATPKITETREPYKNIAYVEGGDDDIAAVESGEDTTVAGIDRFEMGVTASDIKKTWTDSGGTEHTRTAAKVRTLLGKRGRRELARACSEMTSFEGEVVQSDGLQYGRDYDVGDRVTCLYRGIQMDATITEISEDYGEGGVRTIHAVLSDGTYSLKRAIQLAAKRI